MGWVGSPAWTESGVALLGVFMRGHVHVHSDISGIVSIASIKGDKHYASSFLLCLHLPLRHCRNEGDEERAMIQSGCRWQS
jgi:hypothetical protein